MGANREAPTEPAVIVAAENSGGMRPGHWVLIGVLVLAVGLLALVFAIGSKSGRSCEEAFTSIDTRLMDELAPAQLEGATSPDPLSFMADTENQEIDVTVGAKRTLTRTVTLQGSRALAQDDAILASVRGDLVRTEGRSIFSQEQVSTKTWIRRGGLLSVAVCLDPRPISVDPGTYAGTISIHGDASEMFAVPISVSVRYPYLLVVYGAAFLGIVVGLFAKALTDVHSKLPASEKAWVGRLTDYMAEPLFVVSTLVGVGLAVYAVFSIYLGDPTFGVSPQDWIGLVGFGFGSVVGGMTLTDFAAALRQGQGGSRTPRVDDQPEASPPAAAGRS